MAGVTNSKKRVFTPFGIGFVMETRRLEIPGEICCVRGPFDDGPGFILSIIRPDDLNRRVAGGKGREVQRSGGDTADRVSSAHIGSVFPSADCRGVREETVIMVCRIHEKRVGVYISI